MTRKKSFYSPEPTTKVIESSRLSCCESKPYSTTGYCMEHYKMHCAERVEDGRDIRAVVIASSGSEGVLQ